MKRAIRIVLSLSLLSIIFASYQNFTAAQIQSLTPAQRQYLLNSVNSSGATQFNAITTQFYNSIYGNCAQTGTSVDTRNPNQQYFCNEIPIGNTNMGANYTQYQSLIQNPVLSPIGKLYCSYAQMYSRTIMAYRRVGNTYKLVPVPLYTNRYAATYVKMCDTYKAQAVQAAQASLAQWQAKKSLYATNYPFYDRAGYYRNLPIAVDMNRATNVSNAIVQSQIGGTPSLVQITNPLGHHFTSTKVAPTGEVYSEICSYFPGVTLSGRPAATDYTVWHYENWFFSITIGATISINPGSFSYQNVSMCGLGKVNPFAANPAQVVNLVGLNQPKFSGAAFSGMNVSVNASGFGIFNGLVNAVINIASFLYTGNTLNTFITSYVQHTYLDPAASSLSNGSYISGAQLNNLINNVNRSQATIRSGTYIQDIFKIQLVNSLMAPALNQSLITMQQPQNARALQANAIMALTTAGLRPQ